jgi:hypothetical protein
VRENLGREWGDCDDDAGDLKRGECQDSCEDSGLKFTGCNSEHAVQYKDKYSKIKMNTAWAVKVKGSRFKV